MAADPQQGPAYDAAQGPEPPPEAMPEDQTPPAGQEAPDAVEEPGPHDEVLTEVRNATISSAMLAKAFGTGEPEQIDVQSLDMAMSAVLKGCQSIAALDPPAKPLAPADELRGQLDANKALLQDHQHSDEMDVQRETARRREGRPQGPSKP